MAEYIVDTTDGILHARTTGELVRYTSHTERHVLECVMRVVGHLCAIGGSAE